MAKKKTAKININNGLSDAIMGFNPGGMGVELSQTDPLYKNNRWYLVSNMRQVLSELYTEHGLIRTIIDVPVDDGLRGGVKIKSKQLSPDEIEELNQVMEREGDLIVQAKAIKWNRLYGGSAIVILTDQDPTTPLDLEALNEDSMLEFRAVDMWELFFAKQNTANYAEAIDGDQLGTVEFYDYYGIKLHHSRAIIMKGLEAPSFIRPRLRGWGLSVIETIIRSFNQYLKANNLIYEVLDEFKIDVFKIKDLASTLMSENGTETVRRRIFLANQQKNFQNAITMDSEDDFSQKELSFAGIAETMTGIKQNVACDLRMPLTKIFGISAAGFSSGEDDIENYNSMVESEIRNKSKYDIIKIIEIRCQKLFGYVPDDIQISFKPLRVLSAEQEENVKTQQFSRVMQAKQAGLIDEKAFADAVNSADLLPIQIEIPPEVSLSLPVETESPQAVKSGLNAPEAPELKNSLEFDVSAFMVDGGDAQYDPWYERVFKSPGKVDEPLWRKAKEESKKAFGKVKWQFVIWYYKNHGGRID